MAYHHGIRCEKKRVDGQRVIEAETVRHSDGIHWWLFAHGTKSWKGKIGFGGAGLDAELIQQGAQ